MKLDILGTEYDYEEVCSDSDKFLKNKFGYCAQYWIAKQFPKMLKTIKQAGGI